ncbi:hypothetical protein [Natrinema gari]|uniref:hypothetical protein n=1 Tax=Natrinema gari TaxID=419186 RepID=UPI000B32ECE3|nr:hypothetical protein [Natrinema gari]
MVQVLVDACIARAVGLADIGLEHTFDFPLELRFGEVARGVPSLEDSREDEHP